MVDIGLLSLAFSAGAVAFFNPCSFALLPAYLSFSLGSSGSNPKRGLRTALEGVKLGGLAVSGLASVFGGIGVLVSLLGSQIGPYLSHFLLGVGPALIAVGALWLVGVEVPPPDFLAGTLDPGRSSFFLFGVAYGLGSLSCVFPVFLMVVFSALGAGGFASAMTVFLAYIIGMGAMMIAASVVMALSREALVEKFRAATRYVKGVSGVILIAAGFYLIYYWFSVVGV
ncbi:hypothetical protein AKJ63_00555 [candidate division MSBL1 archaeon SCGC-AAA259D18]|uniref:Uncharacterized protein n=1 Tax=candidate division MSBL1 archaeon SCGC-AAA259D18 TaxID=1698262 RepID=A0A133UCK7_9EURY|nr:hypothetical protein AKJ63_00555 [candidate division MSBL1 archaeon SCGC-AAA259D18]